MGENKIKKAVIREDLLSITKDFREAIILNQFIYWSERVSDADILIKKENEIAQKNGEEEKEPFYGWMYKTADELAEEVMLGLSAVQTRRYVKKLIDYGYISERRNPKYKWDRTLQYKINLVNIARALKKNGYPLSDYRIEIPDNEESKLHEGSMDNSHEKNQSVSKEVAIPDTSTDTTNIDYHSEITVNPTPKEKEPTTSSPTGLNPHFPEGKEQCVSKEKGDSFKWVAVKQHIISAMRKLGYDGASIETQNAIEMFFFYYTMYKGKNGHNHPRLNDKTMLSVLKKFINGTKEIICTDPDTYMVLIEEHFNTDYRENIDWNIQHFMTDNVRDILWHRVK